MSRVVQGLVFAVDTCLVMGDWVETIVVGDVMDAFVSAFVCLVEMLEMPWPWTPGKWEFVTSISRRHVVFQIFVVRVLYLWIPLRIYQKYRTPRVFLFDPPK